MTINPFADNALPEEPNAPDNEAAFLAEMEPTTRALWTWAEAHHMPMMIAIQLSPSRDGAPGTHIVAANVGPGASETMQFLAYQLTEWLRAREATGTGQTRPLPGFDDEATPTAESE
jgi:hypothetical protein